MKKVEGLTKHQSDGRNIWYYRLPDSRRKPKPLVRVVTGSNVLAVEMARRIQDVTPTILVGPGNPDVGSCEVISNPWTTPEVWEWISHRYQIRCVYHWGLWDHGLDGSADMLFSSIVNDGLGLIETIHAVNNPGLILALPESFSPGTPQVIEEAVNQLAQQVRIVSRSKQWPYAMIHMPKNFAITDPDEFLMKRNSPSWSSPPAVLVRDSLVEACLFEDVQMSGDSLLGEDGPKILTAYSDSAGSGGDNEDWSVSALLQRSELFVPELLDER